MVGRRSAALAALLVVLAASARADGGADASFDFFQEETSTAAARALPEPAPGAPRAEDEVKASASVNVADLISLRPGAEAVEVGAPGAAEIVVVMPEPASSPYKDALQGVCDALGSCPTALRAGEDVEIPASARVVIALGGRAARLSYPARAVLVTALSPGYEARTAPDSGPVVRVRMTFSPDALIRRLLALNPGGKRAALLWSEPASGRFAEAVRAAGLPFGVTVTPVKVADRDAVPALLRGLLPTDELWLAPDSALVTPTIFDAACEYARSAGRMFFAPSAALSARCGVSGLVPDFRAAGLRAGAAAREALAGGRPDEDSYPAEPAPEPPSEITRTW